MRKHDDEEVGSWHEGGGCDLMGEAGSGEGDLTRTSFVGDETTVVRHTKQEVDAEAARSVDRGGMPRIRGPSRTPPRSPLSPGNSD